MLALHFFHDKMHEMHSDLRRLDLNLLLVFDALYRSRSVTAAANELAMSPSACSHALSRLRLALSDELFIRYGSAMQPTIQAEQLSGSVVEALSMLSSGLSAASPFEPSTSKQVFNLAASDITALALLPSLTARLEEIAPHVKIKVHHSRYRDSLNDLAVGRAQFVLGFSDEQSSSDEGIEALEGPTDDYVIVTSNANPILGSGLSLRQYLESRHIAVMPWTDAGSVIDTHLAKLGLKRKVTIQVPGMASLPLIMQDSHFLVTIPRRAAGQIFQDSRFVLHETPFLSPLYTLKVFFHARYCGSAAQRWMLEQLKILLDNIGVQPSKGC